MLKKYIAKSIVGITVQTGNLGRRVSFVPLSNNKSYFETADGALQAAIERHAFFKSGLIAVEEAAPAVPAGDGVVEEPVGNSAPGAPAGEGGEELEQVVVAGQSDAVEYLCEHYGLSRSKLRSQKAIADAGAAHGVAFVYNG